MKKSKIMDGTRTNLQLSLEVFRVNPFQSQESERAKMITVTSGRKCYELFLLFAGTAKDEHGYLLKMLADYLLNHTEWYSSRCVLKWKMKGTRFNRLLFQLVPSTSHTEGTESGLLPTPSASENEGGPNSGQNTLNRMVKRKELLPTPTTQDANTDNWTDQNYWKAIQAGIKPPSTTQRLRSMVMLPTPTEQDYKNDSLPPSQIDRNSIPGILLTTGKTSRLNHRFVLEMMGFPSDW